MYYINVLQFSVLHSPLLALVGAFCWKRHYLHNVSIFIHFNPSDFLDFAEVPALTTGM
jgi:hypothetical protein